MHRILASWKIGAKGYRRESKSCLSNFDRLDRLDGLLSLGDGMRDAAKKKKRKDNSRCSSGWKKHWREESVCELNRFIGGVG